MVKKQKKLVIVDCERPLCDTDFTKQNALMDIKATKFVTKLNIKSATFTSNFEEATQNFSPC